MHVVVHVWFSHFISYKVSPLGFRPSRVRRVRALLPASLGPSTSTEAAPLLPSQYTILEAGSGHAFSLPRLRAMVLRPLERVPSIDALADLDSHIERHRAKQVNIRFIFDFILVTVSYLIKYTLNHVSGKYLRIDSKSKTCTTYGTTQSNINIIDFNTGEYFITAGN